MSDLLQERYGVPSPRRRKVLIGATTVLAAVFLGWLAWVAVVHSNPAIDAEVTGYEVIDDHQVRIRLVSKVRDGAEGTCLIRATARDHTIVGELNLTAEEIREAGSDWIPLRTEREATTVEKVRCTED